MVDLSGLQRRVPYALMPVLWLSFYLAAHFGNTSYWLRHLCMRFDLVADDPARFADVMAAQTPASFFEEISGSTDPSARPLHHVMVWVEQAARSVPVVATSTTHYWQSLFTHFLTHHRQSREQSSSTAAPPSLPGASTAQHVLRRLARLLFPCVSSLLVHYNRMSLVNTLISYLYSLSMPVKSHQPFGAARWGPLQDVLGALSGAIIANLVFCCATGSLTPSGLCRRSVLSLMKTSPALNALASAVATTTVLVQSVLPFLAPRASHAEMRVRDPDMLTAVDIAPTGEIAAVSAEAAASIAARPRDMGQSATPHGYVGGGEGVAYALSGFRLGRYHEIAQLQGALWQLVAGVPVSVAAPLREGYSLLGYLRRLGTPLEAEGSSAPTRTANTASRGISSPATSLLVEGAGFDMFYATASSIELYITINGGSFVAGAVLGAGCRALPAVMLWARRHSSLVRAVEAFLWPPPPPALWLPRELEEAVPADQQYDTAELIRVEVARECFVHFPPHALGEAHTLESITAADEGDAPVHAHAVQLGSAHTQEHTTIEATGVSLTLLVPSRCFCPITRSLMRDPVRTQDGFTYDRDAITAWLSHRETSPMTNLPLSSCDLQPDFDVRHDVAEAVTSFLQRVGPDYIRTDFYTTPS